MTSPHVDAPVPRADLLLLGIAVLAVSTSGPLIRYAAAPAFALALWRNVLAVPVLGLAAGAGIARGAPIPNRRERRLIGASGLLLAAHFAAWIPSLSYTSVASSVALVAMQPAWAAVIARLRGEAVARGVWAGIGVAFGGVVLLSGVDLSISTRALFGDVLALVGGILAAAYVTVGAEARRTVDTAVYSAGAYAVAGLALGALCAVTRTPLVGFSASTWLAIVGLVAGAQLLGHTLVNRVLRTISATTVSVAILFEIIGATVIAAIAFDETPPALAVPAAVLIVCGTVMVVRAGRQRGARLAPRPAHDIGEPVA